MFITLKDKYLLLSLNVFSALEHFVFKVAFPIASSDTEEAKCRNET